MSYHVVWIKGINVSKKVAPTIFSADAFFTMKMEAGDFSKELLPIYPATQSNNLEDGNLNI
jgi:hypothetical protein